MTSMMQPSSINHSTGLILMPSTFDFHANMLRTIAIIILLACFRPIRVYGAPQVPCYFVFGDSLSDCGNNNDLSSDAKANYKPYGIDFPGGVPTGRFTNGKTYVDFLSELLGFESFIPPFGPTLPLQALRKGANYASGGGGILDETSKLLGDRMNLDSQVDRHQYTTLKITKSNGGDANATMREMSECLYTINIGSNDYINNYFTKGYTAAKTHTTGKFATLLVRQYRVQVQRLYELGARKVAIFGMGMAGCAPAMIARYGTNGSMCVNVINDAVSLYNEELKSLVDDLNRSLPQATFTYVNPMATPPPPTQELKVLNESCCKTKSNGQCVEGMSGVCKDRTKYIYFDGFHPTEAANGLVGNMAYEAKTPEGAYPMDIRSLISAPNHDISSISPKGSP